MTHAHDDHTLQSITLDDDCSTVVFVKTEDGADDRVFFDAALLVTQMLAMLDEDRAMVDMLTMLGGGEPDPRIEGIMEGKAAVVQSIAVSAVALLDQFAAQEALTGVTDLSDLGFA